MTDSTVYRLERDIRDTLAFRAPCDPPRTEDAEWLLRRIEDAEPLIRADDALRLRTLVKRLSGIGND
jgi:hypothetical protein